MPIIFLFLANIIFTFIVSSPFTTYFKNKMKHSELLEAYSGYDVEALMEFLNNYGLGLESLNVFFLLFLITFFIFGVFCNSCILYAVISKNNTISLRPFWNGGLNYFLKILRLSFYYIISILIFIFLLWKVLLFSGINILEVADDRELMRKFKIGLGFLLVFLALASIFKEYAKIFIAVKNQPFIGSSILRSIRFTFKYFLKTLPLYLINIVVLIIFILIYMTLRNMVEIGSWKLLFFLAQVLLLFKIVIRIIHLDSSYKLYSSIQKVGVAEID